MIAADQPTIFPSNFFVASSSLNEGVIRHPSLDPAASDNIVAWCTELGVPTERTVGLYLTYGEGRTYTDIVELESPIDASGASTIAGWIEADAFVTKVPGVAMLLPVADCNAVVYVDPVRQVMALVHLGWQATVSNLASKVVDYMIEHYDSRPEDLLIYNSPSIRAQSYHFTHLADFGDARWHQPPYATPQPDGTYAIDLVRYNYDRWREAGILPEHIEIVAVDTATSDNYPSHFAGQNSRFAVLAMLSL